MYRGFFFHYAASLLRATRLGMPLDDVEPLDNNGVSLPENAQDLAGFASLLARDYHYTVIFANLHE
jgi:hypothetical protein